MLILYNLPVTISWSRIKAWVAEGEYMTVQKVEAGVRMNGKKISDVICLAGFVAVLLCTQSKSIVIDQA